MLIMLSPRRQTGCMSLTTTLSDNSKIQLIIFSAMCPKLAGSFVIQLKQKDRQALEHTSFCGRGLHGLVEKAAKELGRSQL